MSRKFTFQNNDLILDVAGNKFPIDTADVDLIKRISNFSKEAQMKAAEVAEIDYSDGLIETIEFCVISIDKILGKGASEKIFKDRKVSLFDALDVLNFIVNEVRRDRDEKFNKYDPSRIKRENK